MATSTRPARCYECGGLSFVSSWPHFLSGILFEVILWGSIALAILLSTWKALLLIPVGILALLGLESINRNLNPINQLQVSRARRQLLFFRVLLFSLPVIGYVFFGRG